MRKDLASTFATLRSIVTYRDVLLIAIYQGRSNAADGQLSVVLHRCHSELHAVGSQAMGGTPEGRQASIRDFSAECYQRYRRTGSPSGFSGGQHVVQLSKFDETLALIGFAGVHGINAVAECFGIFGFEADSIHMGIRRIQFRTILNGLQEWNGDRCSVVLSFGQIHNTRSGHQSVLEIHVRLPLRVMGDLRCLSRFGAERRNSPAHAVRHGSSAQLMHHVAIAKRQGVHKITENGCAAAFFSRQRLKKQALTIKTP